MATVACPLPNLPFGSAIPSSNFRLLNSFHTRALPRFQCAVASHPPVLQLESILAPQNLEVAGRALPMVTADVDAVMQAYIDAGQGDRDPFWTIPWPSSIAMAQELLDRPELVRGLRVADLGAGLGLGGIAAGLAGAAEVVFLDRETLSLQCSMLNARLCGLPAALDPEMAAVIARSRAQHAQQEEKEGADKARWPEELVEMLLHGAEAEVERNGAPHGQPYPSSQVVRAEVFDWSQPIALSLRQRFDVVIACDVLYETFSVEPVAAVAPQLLSSDGALLLADPPARARHNRERFLELLKTEGFVAEESGERRARVWEEAKKRFEQVPIAYLALRRGCVGDTIGVKFYNDDE